MGTLLRFGPFKVLLGRARQLHSYIYTCFPTVLPSCEQHLRVAQKHPDHPEPESVKERTS